MRKWHNTFQQLVDIFQSTFWKIKWDYFQQYVCGIVEVFGPFHWRRKSEYLDYAIHLAQVNDTFYHFINIKTIIGDIYYFSTTCIL